MFLPQSSLQKMGAAASVVNDMSGEQKVALTRTLEESDLALKNDNCDDGQIYSGLMR